MLSKLENSLKMNCCLSVRGAIKLHPFHICGAKHSKARFEVNSTASKLVHFFSNFSRYIDCK